MARIELSNIGGGGGGGSTTLALTTTGTSGASVLTTVSGGYSLNIPVYQGALSLSTAGTSGASTLVGNTLTIPTYQGQISLTTTGTSGASTFVGNTLNIPTYQGAISLTTTGTSGAATLVGNTLNVPQYSTAPAGSTGEIQYNSAGAFAASANLAWDNSNVRLNVGAPSAPTARLNVKGAGTLSSTVNLRLTDSGNTEIFRVADDGSILATNLSYDPVNRRLGVGAATTNASITLQPINTVIPSMYFQNTAATMPSYSGSGINPLPNTNTVGAVAGASLAGGGLQFLGFNTSAATSPSIFITGVAGSTSPTYPVVRIRGSKTDGSTSTSALTGDEIICGFATASSADVLQVRANGNVNLGATFTPSARLQVRGANTTAAVGTFIVEDGAATPVTIYRIDNDGKVTYRATNTTAGTTGAQTINRPSGTVNFGIGAGSLVVTNSLCTTSSIVFATVRTNDATAYIKNVVPAAGSFTINLGANATAETSVGFFIIN